MGGTGQDDPGDKEQSSPEEKGMGRAKRKEWVFFLFGRWGLKPELRERQEKRTRRSREYTWYTGDSEKNRGSPDMGWRGDSGGTGEVGTGSLECGAAVKGKRNGDARCEMRCDKIREGLRQGLTDWLTIRGVVSGRDKWGQLEKEIE